MRACLSHRLGLVLALLLAAWLPRADAADEATWQIVSVTGAVSVQRAGATPVSLGSTDGLSPGDVLRTGPDARLVLRRGGDTIFVAPNSDVAIPAEQPGGITTLLQNAGTLLIKVERRATPNFQVRTPYLTAVVKGTSFSVNVDGNGAGVHVLEGQVQVNDGAGTQSALLTPGSTARIGAAPGRALQLDGPAKRLNGSGSSTTTAANPIEARDSGPRITQPIALAAIDIERSSRGLVRSDRGGEAQGRGGRGGSEPGEGDSERSNKSGTAGRSAFAPGSVTNASGGVGGSALGGGNAGGSGNGGANGNGGGAAAAGSGGATAVSARGAIESGESHGSIGKSSKKKKS